MTKFSKDPKEIFQEIVKDYRGIFADHLKSIILYGSAAGKDYRPGQSDVNFMIILSDEGIDHLDRTFEILGKWRKSKVAIPLFLTRNYVERSTDVFPIEYLNFQLNHILVYGEDMLKDLSFDKALIRIQCEREIKGKLLLLREAFLESAGKGRTLSEVISQSMQAFLAIFNALLFLEGMEIPHERRSVIRSVCENYRMNKVLFEKLLDIREQRINPKEKELGEIFKEYLHEVRGLARVIDELGGSYVTE